MSRVAYHGMLGALQHPSQDVVLTGPAAGMCTMLSRYRQSLPDGHVWLHPRVTNPQAVVGDQGSWWDWGERDPHELGRYIDEVNAEMLKFRDYIDKLKRIPNPTDYVEHMIFADWRMLYHPSLAAQSPDGWGIDASSGEPFGWYSYHIQSSNMFKRMLNDLPYWEITSKFERRLIRLYDYIKDPKRNAPEPGFERPKPGYAPPPTWFERTTDNAKKPLDNLTDTLKTVGMVGAVLGGLVGVGYLLHGMGAVKGRRR